MPDTTPDAQSTLSTSMILKCCPLSPYQFRKPGWAERYLRDDGQFVPISELFGQTSFAALAEQGYTELWVYPQGPVFDHPPVARIPLRAAPTAGLLSYSGTLPKAVYKRCRGRTAMYLFPNGDGFASAEAVRIAWEGGTAFRPLGAAPDELVSVANQSELCSLGLVELLFYRDNTWNENGMRPDLRIPLTPVATQLQEIDHGN